MINGSTEAVCFQLGGDLLRSPKSVVLSAENTSTRNSDHHTTKRGEEKKHTGCGEEGEHVKLGKVF